MAGPDPEELLEQHRLYDQYVDVVSAFEWLFTGTASMPDTVLHFERFPKINGVDGNPATPDFSVVFNDGSGLVGEIARIALHEGSVDDLCRQIERYDSLPALPVAGGSLHTVSHVDVLLLVPFDLGTDVVRRVVHERFANPGHDYEPSHPPCVVQYVAQPDKYVFQRRADEGNGVLRDGERDPALGHWLQKGDFKAPAEGFAHVKAQRPFINDPVAPLYLACQLWTKVFPTLAANTAAVGDYKPLLLTIDELSAEVSVLYGPVAKKALREAMTLLSASRCAEPLGVDRWRVAWGNLAHRAGDDLGEVIARRTQSPPAKGPIRRLMDTYADLGIPDPVKTAPPEPGQLFQI